MGLNLIACEPQANEPSHSDTASALAALGLSQGTRVSWEAQDERDETLTFSVFRLWDDQTVLSAQTLILTGLSMRDDQVGFEGLELINATITYSDGTARFDRLELTAPGSGLVEAFSALLTGQDVEPAPLDTQSFERLEVSGLSTEIVNERDGAVFVSLARLVGSQFDGQILQSLEFDTIEAWQHGAFELALSGFQIEGLDVGQLDTGHGFDDPWLFVPGFGTFDLYRSAVMSNLRVDTPDMIVRMPQFESRAVQDNGRVRLSQAMETLVLTPNLDTDAPLPGSVTPDALGYEAFEFAFHYNAVLDQDADRLTSTGQNALSLKDGFQLGFHQDFTGLSQYSKAYTSWLSEGGKPGAMPPARVLDTLRIHEMTVSFEDRSLLDRMITQAASEQDISPDQVRAQARLFVALGLSFLSGEIPGAFANQLANGLMGLVGEGGTIIFALEPEHPISAAVFADDAFTDTDPSEIGLTVRHEPPEQAAIAIEP